MAIHNPAVSADSYEDDILVATPDTAETTVVSGWDAADSMLSTKKRNSDYPVDVKLGEELQLFRFLENEPFAIYKQFWVEKEGKKSYVYLGDDDPLEVIAGLTPRPKFAFNVLNLSGDTPELQVLTASTTLARQLRAANDDPRFGPLTKHYWAISRQGTGPQTVFNLQRVRSTDLEEEWKLDHESIVAVAATMTLHDSAIINVASYEEHLEIARNLVRSA
jgi:hypothetical protein